MGVESTPNEFRATLGSGRPEPVLAKQKRRETDPKTAKLGDIRVSRSESRSSNERKGDRQTALQYLKAYRRLIE